MTTGTPLAKFLGFEERHASVMPLVIGVFLTAALVRIVLLGYLLENDPGFLLDDDSHEYITLAENLALGNGFSWDSEPPYEPNSYRTPGYPLVLLGHKAAFGSFVPAILTQIGLSLMIAFLIVRLGARYFSIRIGLIAAAIFLFMPFSLMVSLRYLTQVTFTAALMGALWYWLDHLEKGRAWHGIIAGLLLPIAALIRPIALFLTAPFIVSAIYGAAAKTLTWERALVGSLLLIVLFAAGIAPWLWRNEQVFGHFSLSSLMSTQLYFYDGPSIYAAAHDVSYEEALSTLKARIDALTGATGPHNPHRYYQFSERTPILIREGLENAFADPVALVETRTVQFFKFFTRDGIHYWLERYEIEWRSGFPLMAVLAERAALGALFVGFLVTTLVAIRRKRTAIVALALVVLYFAVLSGVMSSAGLRYPAEALFILLGIAGLSEISALVRIPFLAKGSPTA
jgi:4-amino-4-deoxy-L-arabinose transferase-like glycosyltransferase